ncbi:hypothetical protein HMPREF1531_00675 [Propionibacterium sp. oral taxon 192 str. F0372]|uniref:hypothetical protein n=1 Tax=Propionibacterium sp. oral taxon 192 TaxID=671222 RepID=UPI0003544BCD|nr:hypothetical protein [Propionibacterium sp. oral taxon 192]EPH06027.1 hypothetical protein HMPREF1531_00675 [Propionibacterium sp. oral taxon 192 str. F0372]
MNFSLEVNPEQIRKTGSSVYMHGQDMVAAVNELSQKVSSPTCLGTDRLGQVLQRMHARTTAVSLEYFMEVAQATEDFGVGLGELADAYEELEQRNLDAVGRIFSAVADLGMC